MADIGALALQVEALSEGAEKSIQRLTKALAKLEAATVWGAGLEDVTSHLGAIQAQIEKINTGKFGDMVKKIQTLSRTRVDGTLTKSMGNIASTSNSVNRSLGNTAVRMGVMGLSLRAVVNTVASFVKYSLDYTENMNLFMVSMGEYAEEAERYANIVSEVMGIDPSTWMRNQGVFMALAEGFGVASDRAYIMSKNLTQLGHDISSFYNLGIEEAFQKLQSGISGELEPLRRLGIDLSEARLKAIALELGITKTYTAMTQAEKAQLRYHAIMTQTSKVQGDMARTLDAPANQLRILKASATQAARAIGNTFIPIINSLMPVAIAAANAIRIIASAFASILGFALPSVDYSGISGAANAAGQLDKNLGGAGGSAKELQKALMGFDEINKLPDASGGGGGGGGNLLGDDFNFELLEYDFLGDAVNSRVQQLMQKLSPVLDFIKRNAADILQIAEAVGIAFLEWKIASKFLPDLRTGRNIVNTMKNTLMALTIGAITIGISFKFTKDFLNNSGSENTDWGSFIASGLTSTFGSALTGLVITQATGNSKWGWVASGLTLGISVLSTLVLQYKDVVADGSWYDKENIMTAVLNAIQMGAIGFKFGGLTGAAIAATLTLLATVGVFFAGAIANKSSKENLKRGIRLQAGEIKKFVETQMQFNVDAQISAVDAAIELTQTAEKSLTDSVLEFANNIKLLKLGVDKESVIADLKSQLNGDDGILTNLQSYLEHSENQLKAVIAFAPPKSSNGDSNFAASLFNSNTNFNAELMSSVTLLGNTLADLLEKEITEGLTANEASLANSIAQSIARINAMVAHEDIASDFFQVAGKISWNDLDEESYDAAVKELAASYNQAKDALREYSEAEKAAAQARLWYSENETMPALIDAYNQALNAGNTDAAKMFRTQIVDLNASMSDLRTTLSNWDVEASVSSFGDQLLAPVSGDVLGQVRRRYATLLNGTEQEVDQRIKEIQDKISNANNDVVKAAYENQYGVLLDLYELYGSKLAWNNLGDLMGGSNNALTQEIDAIINTSTAALDTFETTVTEVSEEIPKVIETGATEITSMITDVEKELSSLSDASNFTPINNQLTLTAEQAKGITEAINEIPSEHAITLSIPGYSTIINRINNIATRVKSIASGTVNIKVKAGVDSGSKAFLLQLAAVSPSSTLAGQLINLVNVSAFARGGFPKNGELFIANENGPELVGRIGNKTAVANEDQIGDTILNYMEQAEGGGGSLDEERLASVLVRALKNAGVGAVRIDGRDIVRSLNRETQRTGHTPLTIK